MGKSNIFTNFKESLPNLQVEIYKDGYFKRIKEQSSKPTLIQEAILGALSF